MDADISSINKYKIVYSEDTTEDDVFSIEKNSANLGNVSILKNRAILLSNEFDGDLNCDADIHANDNCKVCLSLLVIMRCVLFINLGNLLKK